MYASTRRAICFHLPTCLVQQTHIISLTSFSSEKCFYSERQVLFTKSLERRVEGFQYPLQNRKERKLHLCSVAISFLARKKLFTQKLTSEVLFTPVIII